MKRPEIRKQDEITEQDVDWDFCWWWDAWDDHDVYLDMLDDRRRLLDDSPAVSWDTAGGPIRHHLIATKSPAFSVMYSARATENA